MSIFFPFIRIFRKRGLELHNSDLVNLSNARLLHARDCLKEAAILLAADEYKGTANRAYYAAFHALRAVLILDGFDSKKHFI